MGVVGWIAAVRSIQVSFDPLTYLVDAERVLQLE